MRGAVLACLIVAFSGCATLPDPDAPDERLPRLSATYDVAIHVGERNYSGQWRLSTQPSRSILDRDGSHRLAWPVQVHLETGPEHGRPDAQVVDLTVWLDASLHVVREDVACGQTPCQGPGLADWDGQGSPAPFGLGWEHLLVNDKLPYQVDGRDVRPRLVPDGDAVRLEDGAALGSLVATDPDMRYVFDGQWLPAEMRLDLPRFDYELRAVRTALSVGDPLPPAEVWPKEAYAGELARPRPPLFAGANHQAFHMGFTFDDALRALFRHDPAAQPKVANGCVLAFAALWTDRLEVIGPPLGDTVGIDGDLVVFYLLVQDRPGHRIVWQWAYGPFSPESGADGRFLFGDPGQSDLDPATDLVCLDQGADRQTAQNVLQDSWQLPVDRSGLPCGLLASRTMLRVAGGGTAAGHAVLTALRYDDVQDNHPQALPRAFHQTSRNLQANHWSQAVLDPADQEALDAGDLPPRPLPPDAGVVLDPPRYECVEPRDSSTTPQARIGPDGNLALLTGPLGAIPPVGLPGLPSLPAAPRDLHPDVRATLELLRLTGPALGATMQGPGQA